MLFIAIPLAVLIQPAEAQLSASTALDIIIQLAEY